MLESDRCFPVEAEPHDVWSSLRRPERYRAVWPLAAHIEREVVPDERMAEG